MTHSKARPAELHVSVKALRNYHIVRDQVPFRELGPDWQRRRYSPEHRAQRLQRQLEALGYSVVIEQRQEAEQAA